MILAPRSITEWTRFFTRASAPSKILVNADVKKPMPIISFRFIPPLDSLAFFSSGGFLIPNFISVSANFFSAFSNADNSLANLAALPSAIIICLACKSSFLLSMSVSLAIFLAFRTKAAVFLFSGIGGGFIGRGGGIPLALFSAAINFCSICSNLTISS